MCDEGQTGVSDEGGASVDNEKRAGVEEWVGRDGFWCLRTVLCLRISGVEEWNIPENLKH